MYHSRVIRSAGECASNGAWRMAYGVWRMAHGAWRMAYGAHGAYGVWRMAYGVWRMAYGVWRTLLGFQKPSRFLSISRSSSLAVSRMICSRRLAKGWSVRCRTTRPIASKGTESTAPGKPHIAEKSTSEAKIEIGVKFSDCEVKVRLIRPRRPRPRQRERGRRGRPAQHAHPYPGAQEGRGLVTQHSVCSTVDLSVYSR